MSDDDYDPDAANGHGAGANGEAPAKKSGGGKKRLSVERIYQKKTQLEHILLRPDTYIGSVQLLTEKMWIYDEDTKQIINKEISFSPGLYKIFDEVKIHTIIPWMIIAEKKSLSFCNIPFSVKGFHSHMCNDFCYVYLC